nr:PO protein [cacao polerovirus]
MSFVINNFGYLTFTSKPTLGELSCFVGLFYKYLPTAYQTAIHNGHQPNQMRFKVNIAKSFMALFPFLLHPDVNVVGDHVLEIPRSLAEKFFRTCLFFQYFPVVRQRDLLFRVYIGRLRETTRARYEGLLQELMVGSYVQRQVLNGRHLERGLEVFKNILHLHLRDIETTVQQLPRANSMDVCMDMVDDTHQFLLRNCLGPDHIHHALLGNYLMRRINVVTGLDFEENPQ